MSAWATTTGLVVVLVSSGCAKQSAGAQRPSGTPQPADALQTAKAQSSGCISTTAPTSKPQPRQSTLVSLLSIELGNT